MAFNPTSSNLILIVDDIPTNLAVMSETLMDVGFEVAIATSGERALEQIRLELPDLILLDIMMPGMGGFELCRRLQSDEKLNPIPIIFMTASTDLNSKVRGLELGAVDYITKPFEAKELVARINTHLELKEIRCKLQRSENRLNSILGSIKEIVWSAYLNPLEILYLNPIAEDIYGCKVEGLLQKPDLWLSMIHPEDRAGVTEAFRTAKVGQSLELDYRLLTTSGELRWIHCQGEVSWHEVEKRLRADGIARDVSEIKKAEQQLHHSARYDSLTNLVNRAHFTERLTQILERPHQRRRDLSALLFIDLDRFKAVNDELGHGVGDQLLIQVSNILKRSTREYDCVARLGGDEFTILLTNLSNTEEALLISNRIQTNLKEPILIEKQELSITASIGIVADFSRYKTAKEVLHHADLAMYQAKRLGKACHQLFEPEIYEQALVKQRLEHELKHAIEKHELQLFYQPIRTLKTDQLKGFEALMRWQHPEQGMIPPSTFIPLAESTGLIIPLGECLIHLACQQICAWQKQYDTLPNIQISLNISGKQLQHPNFFEFFDQTLAHYNLSPSWFNLELTESTLMEKSDQILQQLQRLRQRGFHLSLDDFGTGYSSLSYLHRFPINTLKIDRSFVQTMEPESNGIEIIRTILALAKTLKMTVVAEGVETAQQVASLKTLNCDTVQGYFFARPLYAEAATQYLHREHPENLSETISLSAV
ncbi:MAG: EAL domain-containing protein [Cyanobacteria bacterium P01_F01_bin.53]